MVQSEMLFSALTQPWMQADCFCHSLLTNLQAHIVPELHRCKILELLGTYCGQKSTRRRRMQDGLGAVTSPM